jgi:hypothetical protein
MRLPRSLSALSLAACVCLGASPARAWFDETHIAIADVADTPFSPCLAVAADAMTHKVPTEGPNHYSNVGFAEITPGIVRGQVARANHADPEGHLYGAIIASYRALRDAQARGARAAYPFGFLAHYVGDLAQPLHNVPHDSYNRANHARYDGVVNDRSDLRDQIRRRMVAVRIPDEDALVAEVVRIANATRALERTCRARGWMTQEEAFEQLARSASLLRGIVEGLGLDAGPPAP